MPRGAIHTGTRALRTLFFGRRDRRQNARQDRSRIDALEFRFGPNDHAMRQDERRRCFYIVGRCKIAALHCGGRLRRRDERECCARAGTQRDVIGRPRSGDNRVHIFLQCLRKMDGPNIGLRCTQFLEARNHVHARRIKIARIEAGDRARDERALLRGGRIAGFRADEKTIELRLGQRIRALVFDRVLRSADEERRRQRMGFAIDRRLTFFHCFKQCGLCFGWRPVNFVG